eukprot:GHRR01001976.1.p1 GENE.GHRR01001976.1~~GHRR01001976.1.p1  ORF type:complete len:996 (+),score=422.55 GHRR01001976.1:2722-5709(+)
MTRINFTLQRFPATGPLKDASGIPQSCVVQPFAQSSAATAAASSATLSGLARCQHCYAYINHLCDLTDSSFKCSICGKTTELKHLTTWHNRYCRYPAARQYLPELQQHVYEVIADPELRGSGMFGHSTQQQQQYLPESTGSAFAAESHAVPVTLVLVDVAGPEEFLELVRSGLNVALEALHPAGLFGIIGVSDSISLVDVSGSGVPCLHHLPVLEAAPVLAPLQDVVPLNCLLAPVAEYKHKIAQTIDLLMPDPWTSNSSSSRIAVNLQQPSMDRRPSAGAPAVTAGTSNSTHPGDSHSHQQQHQQHATGSAGLVPPCRAVGPAIQAVIEYLQSLQNPAATNTALASSKNSDGTGTALQFSGIAQLLVFLSGPPDIGYGRTVALATAAAGSSRAAAGARTVGPNAGVAGRQVPDLQLHYPVQDPKSKSFYEQAALAAASMGVVVDVYAAARGYVGLQTLEPLVNSTGGALYLYPSMVEATLPQDLYRRLSTPKALAGMLRLRTCPQVKVSRCYGRLWPDQQYADLFHVPCCDPGQAFVFDFDHVGSGVYDERFKHVALQVAFQYSQVMASKPGSSNAEQAANSSNASSRNNAVGQEGGQLPSSGAVRGFVVQRRLRVCTIWLPVALGPAEVYSNVDADAVLTVLTHKITKAVRAQSVSEARLLLRDWLVIFTTNYHRSSFMRASAAQLLQLPVDLTFVSCPSLQPLPRLVYALLRSPLLSSAAQYHSDLTAYLHHLWCCLPPDELAKAVYPGLWAFADPDTLIAGGLPLSRQSLRGALLAEAAAATARSAVKAEAAAQITAAATADSASSDKVSQEEQPRNSSVANEQASIADQQHINHSAAANAALALAAAVAEKEQPANIFLLDAFILVLVVYCQGASANVAYPPPQHSKLWRMISDIKRARRVTVHVEVVREGIDEADLFYSLLIDDPDDVADSEQQQQAGQAVAVASHAAGAGSSSGPAVAAAYTGPSPTGVAHFIEHIRAEVFTQLQPAQ